MKKAERILLSNRFREFTSNLPIDLLRPLEETLLYCFEVKDIRNVQLWTRLGIQQRNFIKTNSSSQEFYRRVWFARGILGDIQYSGPVKQYLFTGDAFNRGRKLAIWLSDPYFTGTNGVGGAIVRFDLVGTEELLLTYKDESPLQDELIPVRAEDSDEDDILFDPFDDIFSLVGGEESA